MQKLTCWKTSYTQVEKMSGFPAPNEKTKPLKHIPQKRAKNK